MPDVWKRGHTLLIDSLYNKGTAFTNEERELDHEIWNFDYPILRPVWPEAITSASRRVRTHRWLTAP